MKENTSFLTLSRSIIAPYLRFLCPGRIPYDKASGACSTPMGMRKRFCYLRECSPSKAGAGQEIMCCFRIGNSKGKKSSHAHKTGSRYLSEVLFRISNEHLRPFKWEPPPRFSLSPPFMHNHATKLISSEQFPLWKWALLTDAQCPPRNPCT